ncbi:MAG: hypothetical protein P8Y36_05225, partial [Alphaproteobacteria bacterium]
MSMPELEVQSAPRQVHLALTPKGGVGKSLISIFVSQFLKSKGDPVLCFDADATTATFSGFKALDVKRIEMRDGQTIDERRLDEVMDPLLNEDAHI